MQNTVSKIKIMKNFIAVGAAPGTAIGVASDFFAPENGWKFAATLGTLAILLTLIAIFFYGAGTDKFHKSWIYNLTKGDPESDWIWDGSSPLKTHGIQVALTFSIVCLLLASKSYASSTTGGYIGSNFTSAAKAQELMGIVSKQQAETNETLRQLISTVKRETSSDPRKELQNLGIGWSEGDLQKAINNRDKRAIALLYQSEVHISDQSSDKIAFQILTTDNTAILTIATHYSSRLSEEKCRTFVTKLLVNESIAMGAFLGGGGNKESGIRDTSEIKSFINSEVKLAYLDKICGNNVLLSHLKDAARDTSKRSQENINILMNGLRNRES
jgi:hypothetical protein